MSPSVHPHLRWEAGRLREVQTHGTGAGAPLPNCGRSATNQLHKVFDFAVPTDGTHGAPASRARHRKNPIVVPHCLGNTNAL